MPRILLTACLLLLPTCSGCAVCGQIINFFLSDNHDEQWEQQNATFQAYEDERKEREEKSKDWSASALP